MQPGDKISINLNDLNAQHVVYSVYAEETGTIIYVGACQQTNLLSFPDANKNSQWRILMKLPQYRQRLIVSIIDITPDAESAQHLQAACITALQPYCNLNGKSLHGPNTPIICNEDGIEYPSMRAAADEYGVPHTSISNHLAERSGYKWLHRKNGQGVVTFRRA